ncbi:hypothetical protein ACQ4WP_08770 [Janthinobacterium sp. GB4P2]|uniref:hypothetical protein n=1 Tax=Janthinobacterium sp. GB4P2 TaxID=3424189 RepID=UPI003F20F8B3
MAKGRYYLGRVIKLGLLDQDKLMNAIVNSPVVEIGKFDWTITDVVDARCEGFQFIFGKLSKYAKNGHVKIVDENSKSQINAEAPNLLEASSPFIYLPEYSGLSFLHVWNGIQADVFPKRFAAIIEKAYDGFFVNCEVESVADYKEFIAKLQAIDVFTEMSAKVYPPNPMFGRLWESLNSYVRKRQVADVSIKETSMSINGINTEIVSLIRNIIDDPLYQPAFEPDITDAAILMAADGYGAGKVTGLDNGVEVIVKTADTQKSFLFDADPEPYSLARESIENFSKIKNDRNMGH